MNDSMKSNLPQMILFYSALADSKRFADHKQAGAKCVHTEEHVTKYIRSSKSTPDCNRQINMYCD
jgi:hypothetical protein